MSLQVNNNIAKKTHITNDFYYVVDKIFLFNNNKNDLPIFVAKVDKLLETLVNTDYQL